MKQHLPQSRSTVFAPLATALAIAAFATTATAAGLGGSLGGSFGASMNSGGQLGASSLGGGAANVHMSPSGKLNSNAQWQMGASQGADRAAERMPDNGAGFEQIAPTEAAGHLPSSPTTLTR